MDSNLPRFYVYLLSRPNGRVFYVGKGSRYRINQHEGEARSSCRCRKCNTIRKIWREGGEVRKQIVFRTNDEQLAYDYEIGLIKYYGQENLVNVTVGGLEARGMSKDGRSRIAEANRKRIHTPSSKLRQREKMLGRKLRPETIEKMKLARQRRKTELSEEARRRIGEASRARVSKPEMQAKLVAARKGILHSDERRAKEKLIAQKRAKSETWKRNQQQALEAYRQKKNQETVTLIRGLLDQGLSAKEIVEETGLGMTTVRRWKARIEGEVSGFVSKSYRQG